MKAVKPGEVLTIPLGRTTHRYEPVLDAEGRIVIRPIKIGDLFLAHAKRPRVHKCDGIHLRPGPVRQILRRLYDVETAEGASLVEEISGHLVAGHRKEAGQ